MSSSSVIQHLRDTTVKINNIRKDIASQQSHNVDYETQIRKLKSQIEKKEGEFNEIHDACHTLRTKYSLSLSGNMYRKDSKMSVQKQVSELEHLFESRTEKLREQTHSVQQAMQKLLIAGCSQLCQCDNLPAEYNHLKKYSPPAGEVPPPQPNPTQSESSPTSSGGASESSTAQSKKSQPNAALLHRITQELIRYNKMKKRACREKCVKCGEPLDFEEVEGENNNADK